MPGTRDLLAWLAAGEGQSQLPLLLVAAHPDDETIGFGGQLARFPRAVVLHTTDGAPRDGADATWHGFVSPAAYAAARRGELHAALTCAGIAPAASACLGVPDQEASLHLTALARGIAQRMQAQQPAVVVTHAYEGGHPDHDATCWAVHAACRIAGGPPPLLLEMAGYHGGDGGMTVGSFLPAPEVRATVLPLSAAAAARKRRMLACFRTQREVLAAFHVGDEALRPAPRYDFARPPHPGTLHFERHPWGMTGARFRQLAAAAAGELGLAGVPCVA